MSRSGLPLAIGSHCSGDSNFFKGTLDEFKIYNYAETAQEISEAAQSPVWSAFPKIDGYRCPDYSKPKDGDVNDDGKADWLYEKSVDDAGNSIELWGVDPDGRQNWPIFGDHNDEFFAVIFGNLTGKYFVGKCVFEGGQNSGHILVTGDLDKNGNADRLIQSLWRSEDGGLDDANSAPGRDAWEYSFDIGSGLLRVTHFDKDANILSQYTREPSRWASPGEFNDLEPIIFNFGWDGEVMTTVHSLFQVDCEPLANVLLGSSVAFNITVHNMGNQITCILKIVGLDHNIYTLSQTTMIVGSGQTTKDTLTVSPPLAGIVLGDHVFKVIASTQFDDTSRDCDAVVRINYTPALPKKPSGGLVVAIQPKTTTTSAGTNIVMNISVTNNENFNDAISVNITLNGLAAQYQANLSWFNWTNLQIFVPSKATYTVQLNATIPAGTSIGTKAFKVEASSAVWSKGFATSSGAIVIK